MTKEKDIAERLEWADARLRFWLRRIALYSNDGWLAREARYEFTAYTGGEPLADWELELLESDDGEPS